MEEYQEVNEFQTPLADLNLDKEPDEIKEQFWDFFYNVPFIQSLVSVERKRAKDLPRDKEGKIIVDVTHPHILEDMDYFRPAALYYQKNGCYTKLRPNSNPNSEYGKWCVEEARRCREGYVRESDGEWIPGDYYYFLNYCPMQLVKKKDKNDKKGMRVFEFPNVWEGHYLKAHTVQQAREKGHHYAELASRSKGKAHPYDEWIYTTEGLKQWGEIKVGDYVYGDDGLPTKVIAIPFDGVCPIYEIELANGKKVKCSEGHLWKVSCGSKEGILPTSVIRDDVALNCNNKYYIPTHKPILPYGSIKGFKCLMKLFYTEDFYTNKKRIKCVIKTVEECKQFKFLCDCYGVVYDKETFNADGSFTIVAFPKRKKIQIVNITYVGEEPAKCITVDNKSHCYLINDFIVTHNSYYAAAMLAKRFVLGESKEVNKKVVSYITADDRKYLTGGDQTLDKFQFDIDWVANNMQWPSKRLINSLSNMQWIMGYKNIDSGTNQGTLNSVIGVTSKDDPQKLRGTRGVLYVIEEFGTFGSLLDLVGNLRPSVEEGEDVFGLLMAYGTAGDNESDFMSAQEIVYNPEGYNFLALDNVYDKFGQGKKKFAFFFPGYLNMANHYDSNGNSDVTAALLAILKDRHWTKYHVSNPSALTKRIAEIPITPQEAMLKTRGNMFPVTQINDRINEIDNNPHSLDDVYIGRLVQEVSGNVKFVPTDDTPIRDFPLKDNKEKGAIEIFEMPQKDARGDVFSGRYIIGHDPVDDDCSDTLSLTSTFVLDLFTDRIVAEYTGRQDFADDNFEIVRLLCLFYNTRCLFEAHAYSEKVPTPDGFKLWKDIKIGDTLFSPTKGEVKVIDIPVDTYMPIYKVTLADGRVITASDRHVWSVYKRTSKNTKLYTTEQMLSEGVKDKYNHHLFYLPESCGVEYGTKKLPIDPYTMGLILAEGSIRGSHCKTNYVQISSSFEDMMSYKMIIPYECKHIGKKGFSWHLKINGCKDIMENLGLLNTDSHTKFIPDIYKYSNRAQRFNLLQGLMDGDGYSGKQGSSIYVTVSEKLAQDIMSLARSLGIKTWLQKASNGSFRVSFATEYKIFKLPRKIVNQHVYKPYTKGSKASAILLKTAIEKIEFSHYENGKCVTVDSDDGLYFINDYVVTHNSNKKGIFAYFSTRRCLHLLADTPEYLKDKQIIKEIGYGNKSKGVNASKPVNDYANRLLKDWLLKPVPVIKKDANGEDVEVMVPNLSFIKSRALLKELALFTPDINVDRVRALGMVMLYRGQFVDLYAGDMSKALEEVDDPAWDDEYFKAYDD